MEKLKKKTVFFTEKHFEQSQLNYSIDDWSWQTVEAKTGGASEIEENVSSTQICDDLGAYETEDFPCVYKMKNK